MDKSTEFFYKVLYSIFYIFLYIFEKLTFQLYKLFYQSNKKLENKKIDIHLKILTGDYNN